MITKKEGLFDAIIDSGDFGPGSAVMHEIEVSARLRPNECEQFAAIVLNNVFRDGTYRPELLEFAMRCAAVQCYSNIDLPEDESRLEDVERLVYDTSVYETILYGVNTTLYNALCQAVSEHINYIRDLSIAAAGKDSLRESMNKLVEMATEYLEKYGKIIERKLKNMKIDKDMLAGAKGLISKISAVTETDLVKEVVSMARGDEKESKKTK